jgi:AraC-like DNA-binding protein
VTTPPPASLRFSTSAFAPREGIPAWRELYGRAIAKLDFEPMSDGELVADATLRSFPGLSFVTMASAELRFSKPRALTHNDGIILTMVDSGHWTGSQLEREVYLDAGDAVLCTNAEIATGAAFGRRVMIRVPADAVAALPNINDMVSRRIPRENQTLRLLRQYLRVMENADQLATPELLRITVTHVHDLLALTLGGTREAAEIASSRGARAARLRAIKDDVAQNLQHGDVSLGAIAARHRVSPRSLQKLFDRDGTTFSEYVLGQRLAHAHHALSDPRRAAEKIASIAFAAGFGDISYFYRAFRRRYDLLPSDLRAAARRPN